MRKKNFLQIILVKPSVGAALFYSYDEMQSQKTAFFCSRPASLPGHPTLMPVYHVGTGCSLSAAKVVPGFYGQKRSRRQAV